MAVIHLFFYCVGNRGVSNLLGRSLGAAEKSQNSSLPALATYRVAFSASRDVVYGYVDLCEGKPQRARHGNAGSQLIATSCGTIQLRSQRFITGPIATHCRSGRICSNYLSNHETIADSHSRRRLSDGTHCRAAGRNPRSDHGDKRHSSSTRDSSHFRR